MQFTFLRGSSQAPRGHAILFARTTGDPIKFYATYCVVLPIPMSLGKYLPPIFASQFPGENMPDVSGINVVPIPPMLEETQGLEYLEILAEKRDDDLCELVSGNANDDSARMALAAEAATDYGQMYTVYTSTFPKPEERRSSPLDDLDVSRLLADLLTDRERLSELAKLIGTARYALDGGDAHLLEQTEKTMKRVAEPLQAKYRADELIVCAVKPGANAAKLAQLFLERGYKILDERYNDIPRIEQEIKDLADTL